mgnify:CR=1 FL=1
MAPPNAAKNAPKATAEYRTFTTEIPAASRAAGFSPATLIHRPKGVRVNKIHVNKATPQAHQSGNTAAAEETYRQILRVDGSHPDALHLLGVLHLQAGEHQQAIDLIEKAQHKKLGMQSNHMDDGTWLSAPDTGPHIAATPKAKGSRSYS